ncbi:MAG TPA: glycoside hydrolase family 88 protein [Acidobacteriaceae bacterium]
MQASRRRFIYTLPFACLAASAGDLLAQTSAEKLPAVGDSPEDAGPLASDLSGNLTHSAIRKAMERVGGWELYRARRDFNDDWTFAALYAGFMACGATLHDPKYEAAMMEMGQKLHWQPGLNSTHADHQAVGQTYLELYLKHRDPVMLTPIRQRFESMMQLPDDPQKPLWWWCDALFMAPPVCARLYRATGDTAYLDFLDREWWITSASLYDTMEHLYFRDKRYFDKREANGKKLFWSRGNGWVMAGLARVLQYMPKDRPSRQKYVEQFQQMSARLAMLQGADGLWRSGLLDAAAYPLPEISGSGFISYAMAYGINAGLLPRKEYGPVVSKAWQGMIAHIYADGRLGCIQPVDAAPGQFKPTSSYVYGVGAFLLAGSELYRFARGSHKSLQHI